MKTQDMNVYKNPIFVMLVGPPGVGKTTWWHTKLKDYIKSGKISRISSDDYIEAAAIKAKKTYTEVFQSAIAEASMNSKQDFKNALNEQNHIVWDQTNLSAKKRKGLLNQLPKNYTKICVYWTIQNETQWKKQLIRPGKTIPQSVLDSMLDNYEFPTHNEGWDVILKEVVR